MANKLYRVGTEGTGVEELQKALVKAGYDVGKTGADGVYGKNTAAAVKQYQKDHGLSVDGIAGEKTLGSLLLGSTTDAGKALKNAAKGFVNSGLSVIGANPATPSATPKTPSVTPATPSAAPAAQPKAKQDGEKPAETPKDNTPADAEETVTTQAPGAVSNGFNYGEFSYGSYGESDDVKKANALLQQHRENKPGAYQSQWQDQINDYLNQIQNRDPFSYDFNADALYQQYKDSYIQQGQMAMMDTMGQAAAMTGGYGNSYAQTVGQQAYNQQLNQLNNVMPELYQMAYDRYAQEGQDLLNQYSILLDRENQDYSRYQGDLSNWYSELDHLSSRYDAERDYDYSKWETERAYAYDEWSSGKDQAWKEYLANQEKEQAAAELMAGTGNFDRLGDVYGLTEDEVASLKDANTPKVSGGGTPTKKYTNLTHEDMTIMQKNIAKAESVEELASLARLYQSMGYNPDQIAELTAGRQASLTAGNTPVNTTVNPISQTNTWVQDKNKPKSKYDSVIYPTIM